MISPNHGLQWRKCITSIAERDSSDRGRRYLIKQLSLRWGRGDKESLWGMLWVKFLRTLPVFYHTLEARPRGGLGILFPDWLEVPQEGALLWYVPAPPLEKKDGPIRPPWFFRHLQAGRGIGESYFSLLRNSTLLRVVFLIVPQRDSRCIVHSSFVIVPPVYTKYN